MDPKYRSISDHELERFVASAHNDWMAERAAAEAPRDKKKRTPSREQLKKAACMALAPVILGVTIGLIPTIRKAMTIADKADVVEEFDHKPVNKVLTTSSGARFGVTGEVWALEPEEFEDTTKLRLHLKGDAVQVKKASYITDSRYSDQEELSCALVAELENQVNGFSSQNGDTVFVHHETEEQFAKKDVGEFGVDVVIDESVTSVSGRGPEFCKYLFSEE